MSDLQSHPCPLYVVSEMAALISGYAHTFTTAIEQAVKPIVWEEQTKLALTNGQYKSSCFTAQSPSLPCEIIKHEWSNKPTQWEVFVGTTTGGLKRASIQPTSFEEASDYCNAENQKALLEQIDLGDAFVQSLQLAWAPPPDDRDFIVITSTDEQITSPMPSAESYIEVLLQNGERAKAFYFYEGPEEWCFCPLGQNGEHTDNTFDHEVIAWRELAA